LKAQIDLDRLNSCSKPIAELSATEVSEMTALINRANADRRDLFSGDRLRPTSLQELYGEGDLIAIIADGAPLGSVTVQVKGDSLWIYLLAVDRPYQRMGLGSVLLKLAEEAAIERRLTFLSLEAVDEGSLIRYYEGLGFTEVDRTTKPLGHWGSVRPFELVTLKKSIRPAETFPAT
jgi:GNAT superfamily N-acetyltransferase